LTRESISKGKTTKVVSQIIATIIVLFAGITFGSGSYAAEPGKPRRQNHTTSPYAAGVSSGG
jgi:hypothetical protein